MKKLGASLPKEGPIKAEPETWTEKHSGQQHEDVYLRTKRRAGLEKFIGRPVGRFGGAPGSRAGA